MKHEIEIEGLPEGWKPVAFRLPIKGENYVTLTGGISKAYVSAEPRLIVEKIPPRRIVLEETDEFGVPRNGEYFERNGKVLCQTGDFLEKYKIWREVKETDLSLTTDEPKLSLSVEECKEILHEFIKKLASLSEKQ